MTRMKRAGLVLVASAIWVYLTVWTLSSFGPQSPLAAFLVVWLIVSWFAVVGHAIHLRAPDGYLRIRTFERDGTLYRRLGVGVFKRLVRRGPVAILSPSLRLPAERTRSELRQLQQRMETAETAHAYAAAVAALLAMGAVFGGWGEAALWTTAFNIGTNLYPVMLQRLNRAWLEELIETTQSSTATS